MADMFNVLEYGHWFLIGLGNDTVNKNIYHPSLINLSIVVSAVHAVAWEHEMY
jgi:hypothetical protein